MCQIVVYSRLGQILKSTQEKRSLCKWVNTIPENVLVW